MHSKGVSDNKSITKEVIENSARGLNAFDVQLPQSIVDSLARFLVPEMRKLYENAQQQHCLGSNHPHNTPRN